MPIPDEMFEILNADPYKIFWALCIKIYLQPEILNSLTRAEAIDLAQEVYKKIGVGVDPNNYPTELFTKFAFYMMQYGLGYGARPWTKRLDTSKGAQYRAQAIDLSRVETYLHTIISWGLFDPSLEFDPKLPTVHVGQKQTILDLLPQNTTRHIDIIRERIEAIRALLSKS